MHYIIINDWANEHQFECGVLIMGIAHSETAARRIFDAHVQEIKDIAEENDWTIYNDAGTEFDAGEPGLYAGNHERLYIEMVNCKDEQ